MLITKLIRTILVLATSSPWAVAQPIFTLQPVDASVSVGPTVQFRVAATSPNQPLTWQWWFKDAPLDTTANPSAAKSMLSLTNVTVAQAGPYYAVATDSTGLSATSEVAVLDVDPTFTKIVTGPIATEGSWAESCSWGDMNNDGRIDLLVVRSGGSQGGPNLMYQNLGDGLFVKVTNAVTRAGSGQSVGSTWADYDNNGTLDLCVSACCGAVDRLFRNDGGGSFIQMPGGSFSPDSSVSHAVAWADYDLDGNADLFVTKGAAKAALYHNDGDGKLTRITGSGLDADATGTHVCSWCDYDGDGYPDLFVGSAYSDMNRLYHNNGDGSFSRVTSGPIESDPRDAWGCAWGDYDNDGWMDLLVTRSVSNNSLYRNNGDGTFVEVLSNSVGTSQGYGGAGIWGDYDNDGYLDLFIANYGDGQTRQNSFLFRNDRQGDFTQIMTGSLVNDQGFSSGSAWGDYDDDGFLDLAVVNWASDSRTFLYRNNGNANHWLKLELVGTMSNRTAIGAKVRVKATIWGKSFWQLREVSGGTGYYSQSDLRAHFGLGDAAKADVIRIEWPSGLVQELRDVAANQLLTVTEHQEGSPAASSLTAARSADGAVQLTLTGPTEFLYVFEASPNLVQWTKLAVRTNLTGTVECTDTTATNYARRFYRGVAP